MNPNKAKNIVIFDRECGICQFLKAHAEKRDTKQNLHFMAYQETDLATLSPGLTKEMAARSMYFIQTHGNRYLGAKAFFETMKRLSGIWSVVGSIFSFTPLALLVEPLYRIIAKNRMHISRWLGLQHCVVRREKAN